MSVQRRTKRWTCFAKQQPGKARQKFIATCRARLSVHLCTFRRERTGGPNNVQFLQRHQHHQLGRSSGGGVGIYPIIANYYFYPPPGVGPAAAPGGGDPQPALHQSYFYNLQPHFYSQPKGNLARQTNLWLGCVKSCKDLK